MALRGRTEQAAKPRSALAPCGSPSDGVRVPPRGGQQGCCSCCCCSCCPCSCCSSCCCRCCGRLAVVRWEILLSMLPRVSEIYGCFFIPYDPGFLLYMGDVKRSWLRSFMLRTSYQAMEETSAAIHIAAFLQGGEKQLKATYEAVLFFMKCEILHIRRKRKLS